jgi:hypothetical protein
MKSAVIAMLAVSGVLATGVVKPVAKAPVMHVVVEKTIRADTTFKIDTIITLDTIRTTKTMKDTLLVTKVVVDTVKAKPKK